MKESKIKKRMFFLLAVLGLFGAIQLIQPTKAHGETLYTMTNVAGPNAVAAFNVDPETGRLQFQALYPTGGIGNPNTVRSSQNAMVTDGNYLYVVNPGSNDISVFQINEHGTLTLMGPPMPSGGVRPVSLAVSRQGLMYVANQGDFATTPANYSGFWSVEGHLSAVQNSKVDLTLNSKPSQVLFSDDGKFMVAARPAASTIDTFHVSDSGQLERLGEYPNQPGAFAMQFNPVIRHQLVFTLAFLPGSATYELTGSNELHPLSAAADPFAGDPCWLVIRNDGKALWLSGFFESGVSLHEIGPNGELTFIGKHDTSTFGEFSTFLASDPNQRFMYEVIPGSNVIHAMRITGDTTDGGLSDLQTISVPESFNPIGLVFVNN